MNEKEWLAATDVWPMFDLLHNRASDRKLRLFAVACCRSICHFLEDKRSQVAVESSEACADGLTTKCQLKQSHTEAGWFATNEFEDSPTKLIENPSHASAVAAYWVAHDPLYHHGLRATLHWVGIAQGLAPAEESGRFPSAVGLLRDIFPFHPATFNPSWLTSTVLSLTAGIYQEKAFDRMPILADALQDAGCENEEILNHCRQQGEHVKGCWCVDLILDKK